MFDTRSNLLRLIDDLERDIKENPDRRQTDLVALKEALATIDGKSPPPLIAPRETPSKVREGSKKEYFRSVVNQLIDLEADGRIHRAVVIAQVKALGMFGGSSDVDRDVSKYLSLDGTLEPDGNGYWKRKPEAPRGALEIRP
jgi:hypothetical protein